MSCLAKSSQRALPGLGPNLALSNVTRVRVMSPRQTSSRIPSSKHSCVSSLQKSGRRTLLEALEGVVEMLEIDPGEVGDDGPGEVEGI